MTKEHKVSELCGGVEIVNFNSAKAMRKLASSLSLILKAIRKAAEKGYTSLYLFEERSTWLFDKESLCPYMYFRSFDYSDQDLEELKRLGYKVEEEDAIPKHWLELKGGRWDKAIQRSKKTKWFSKELKDPDLASSIKYLLNYPKVHIVRW